MHDPSYLLAEALGTRLRTLNLCLALAESCTGGGIAKAITDVPGSSGWFDRGFVTYSNDAKIDMLGVKPETLATVGAVSEETALAMAAGALTHSNADVALAVTGIAGPDGGTPVKPVGTVFVAWQIRGAIGVCLKKQFSGDRQSIRQQVTLFCLQQLLHVLETLH
ncbi:MULTISPECIES: CinA family protein [Methylomonas]|uniref:Damage-inducible protein CinA n=2 Tax=Methylomonas TaxID=416 RepID=A0A126T5T4_9GAMM|nr:MULTISPECIES: CinA family protein [Methylomonas]AMK77451.1 damage-inducible protein CinA [Methylomonas denitrificans]OAI05192.1 damage-inducible protein CinA [Methylomonas methanica]TCV84509.1 nicotinamide-nucleotide amidase [Methylomonas methanica]